MILTFRLRFHTQPGQSLWLAAHAPLPEEPVPLRYVDHEAWEVTLPLAADAAGRQFHYAYVLRQADGTQITDWGRNRSLTVSDFPGDNLLVIDTWNLVGAIENVFYTEPFKKVLLADRHTVVKFYPPQHPTHTFRVKAPLLAPGQTLCLLGEGAALGNWNTTAPILLHRPPGADDFAAPVELSGQTFPVTYKYGVFDVAKNEFVRFEEGANRHFWDAPAPGKHTVVNDGFARLPLPRWRGAGVAVPVFSLRSESSFGVGEFADLKALADWGRQAGLKLIQLLPVNDTSATHTWRDSYPYAAISAFALHPQYINLAAVVTAKNRPLLKEIEAERQRLNALSEVDYQAVMQAKLGFMRKIFPSQRATTLRAAAYREFFAENQSWLVPYAAFCYLRDLYGTPDFSHWPEHQTFNAAVITALTQGNTDIEFHYFVQYHLHRQLQDAAAHVHAAGLVLKGDIAIGVYRHGADAWQQPELYHLDMQAGAPPDPFAAKGQNWGFPTYNWPRMAADGFAWWRQRFAQMRHYFDAFRIDHILGFFRIWSSPAHAVEGILGYFVPAIPIEPAEFQARGVFLDRKRFTQPYISGAVLTEVFGGQSGLVREQFLHHLGGDFYDLKPEFTTQRAVDTYFAGREANKLNAYLRAGLFDLISNVILLEVDGRFHFRFGMETTLSFQRLAPDTQARLRELYVDYFYRRQDEFWKHEALQKLPALKRGTDMLICGEDLGMVPACVPEVMRDLGLLSLEIQRMPKNPAREFSRPAEAPYLSVVTPSTHDMSTIRGWWTEEPALTQKFYERELGGTGPVPQVATPEIVAAVVGQHLASPAMWSIFQLQDLLGMDGQMRREEVDAERINVPAIPSYYWRYRLHHTLEQLQSAAEFNARLRQLLRDHGRA